ncbi:MAG: phosphatidate cytidylyltransferase [Gammaproteobacteria bacterium]|nr:MAG: phosphatidate cytidylyltransferase [Gammaproteobacteria bacterium]
MTALILVPLAIALLFMASAEGFALGIFPVILLASVEWCCLAGLRQKPLQFIYLVVIALLMAGVFYDPWAGESLLFSALGWWLVAGWVLLGYPDRQPNWFFCRPGMLLAGPLILVVPWFALYRLRAQSDGDWLVLFLFALIWGADIGAYFSGRRWGRRKLLPTVSPGKTWQGVAGGSAVALVVALVAAILSGRSGATIGYFLLVGLVISWVSVIGDLTESLFKRRAGVKDSGKLLPGHGGVLDRIDSLTIAAPLFGLLMAGHW